MAPIDLIACLVSDELTRRADRLLERRRKHADLTRSFLYTSGSTGVSKGSDSSAQQHHCGVRCIARAFFE